MMLDFVEKGNPENPERKTFGVRENPKSNLTHIQRAASGRKPTVLVGGKRSNHCAIPLSIPAPARKCSDILSAHVPERLFPCTIF